MPKFALLFSLAIPSKVLKTYPRITLITPSYNQGAYLEQTIRSVLDQQYPNLEYFVIDGGSTDNSVEILRRYESRLSYWVSEPDQGQSHAINKGLALATGEIINWINSDDYLEPFSLFKVATAFKQPQTLVVCGRGNIIREGKPPIISKGTDVYPDNLPKTIGWARIDQPQTFFHARAITRLGPLDERLHYLMDRDWWIRFLLMYGLKRIVKIPDTLSNFRLHEASKTVSQSAGFQRESDTYFYALAKHHGFLDYAQLLVDCLQADSTFTYLPLKFPEQTLRQALNYYLLLRANELYAQNQWEVSAYLLEAVQLSWLSPEDAQICKRLRFRSRYIPKQLLTWLRR
jgi:glycosyltransferase involved in cell wall biosynthesis